MLAKVKPQPQPKLFTSFRDTLNQQHPLYILSNKIDWKKFEEAFSKHYSKDFGRPAKPIRLMVGLLILKHVRNVSDESVVEQWSENIYYQFFCGGQEFVACVPCEASELVHFRNRIGAEGIELIFQESIRINGKDAQGKIVAMDTTVQEKNITFPTDDKLHRKIIKQCNAISEKENLEVRQNYVRVLKKLRYDQRFRNHPKNKNKARKADKKVKTIAGRLVRELERNLAPNSEHQIKINLFQQGLSQTKQSREKIYSLHEKEVQCISKGKAHKKYEFGNKVSIGVTAHTGVIVGAKSFRNEYDGKTIAATIKQIETLQNIKIEKVIYDRGGRGQKKIGEVEIITPNAIIGKTEYAKRQLKKLFGRRAAIEPIIGHLKSDHRLNRNFYKGLVGDNVNVLLCCAAYNFKRMMNKWKSSLLSIFQDLFFIKDYPKCCFINLKMIF